MAFGLTLQFTGSYRAAILSIVVFFISGLILFARVNLDKGMREAHDNAPAVGSSVLSDA